MLNISTFKNFKGRRSGALDTSPSYAFDTTYQTHNELCNYKHKNRKL